MVVNELVTKFSYVGSDAPLVGFAGKLGIATAGVAAITAAIGGAYYALQQWTSGVTAGLDPLIQLSRTTGIAVGNIQALGYAASVSGSSADAMYSSIDSLSEKIGEAAQKGSEDFSRLGISVRDMNGRVKDAPQIIDEVSNAFQRMNLSMPERRRFAASLGIDPSLVQLLSKTSGELGGLMNRAREMGVLTKDQADAAADYNDSLTSLNFAMDALRQHVAVALAPEFRQLVEETIDLIIVNKEWISDGIMAAVGALVELMKSVRRMMPVLGALAAGFVAAKIYALGLAGAMGVIFSPLVLVTAAVVALWLVVDDLIVGMKGGKSVIKSFFSEFLKIDFTDLVRSIKAVDEALGDLLSGNFVGAWDGFKEAAQAAFTFVKDLFSGLFDNFAPEWLTNLTATIEGYTKALTSQALASPQAGAVTDFSRDLTGRSPTELITEGARTTWGAFQNMLSGVGEAVSMVQNNTFSIQSNDPAAVATAVEIVLQRQLENNNTQLGSDSVGVRGGM